MTAPPEDLIAREESYRPLYDLLPNNFRSNQLANAIVIASAHMLYGLTLSNTKASAQFVQIFDLAALPADGATPDVVLTVAANSDKALQYIPPRKMLQGIAICNSSTAATKTIGSADCFFDVQYL